jgi:sulfur-carrier protein
VAKKSEREMEVTIKYFAWVRERIGTAEEKAVLPDNVATVGGVIRWLKARGRGYAAAFEREDIIRAAIDQTHAKHSAPVAGAREIAFFPPVTGG